MNNITRNTKENKKNFKINDSESVHIVNNTTGEVFSSNERTSFSDFNRLSKQYGCDCSLYIPEDYYEPTR